MPTLTTVTTTDKELISKILTNCFTSSISCIDYLFYDIISSLSIFLFWLV